jgi:hypothetical protein
MAGVGDKSVFRDDRPVPVEFVIQADQGGLRGRFHVQDFAGRNQAGNGVEVLPGCVLDPDIVVFREYRPVWRKHPFGAGADGHSGQGEAGGLRESAARLEYLISFAQERHAELAIAKKRRREQVAKPAGRGDHGLETVGLRERREVRQGMPAVDAAEVELTLHANHQIAADLEVAAGLTAADEAAVIFVPVGS